MNENLNLVEILKDCPKGTKLYSTIFGEVKLHEVRYGIDIYTICIENKAGGQYWLTSDGRYADRFDGECTLFPSREQRDWSKFTNPWYKKEKFVEPKFHVGQYVTDGYVGGQITSIEDNYHCYKILDFMGGTNTTIPFTLQDNYHLWTIKDAMDGDILLSPSTPEGDKECPFIFKEIDKDRIVRFHAALLQSESIKISDGITNVMGYANAGYHTPATKEQRDALMKAINDAGYEWNAKKKELKKLVEVQDRFDPKTLRPYNRVIARDEENATWRATLFSHYNKDDGASYPFVTIGDIFSVCIPYNEDTKHLVGTKDKAPEYYRYWED